MLFMAHFSYVLRLASFPYFCYVTNHDRCCNDLRQKLIDALAEIIQQDVNIIIKNVRLSNIETIFPDIEMRDFLTGHWRFI